MPLYRAYGLAILADGPLPFRPCEPPCEPDVHFVHCGRSGVFGPPGEDRRTFARREDGWSLRYDARDGGWLVCDYRTAERRLLVSGTATWAEAARPLVGIVCAALLGLGGRTLLHGACLAVGGRAVAILGASGQGKSTLAAALIAQGAGLLSEDLLVLERDDKDFHALAGAQTLTLLDDAYEVLGKAISGGGAAAPAGVDGKREIRFASAPPASVRLGAVHVLEPLGQERADTSARLLSGPEAVMALVGNLYGSAWIRPPDGKDMAFCAALAGRVPVFALSRPVGPDGLPATAATLRRLLETADS